MRIWFGIGSKRMVLGARHLFLAAALFVLGVLPVFAWRTSEGASVGCQGDVPVASWWFQNTEPSGDRYIMLVTPKLERAGVVIAVGSEKEVSPGGRIEGSFELAQEPIGDSVRVLFDLRWRSRDGFDQRIADAGSVPDCRPPEPTPTPVPTDTPTPTPTETPTPAPTETPEPTPTPHIDPIFLTAQAEASCADGILNGSVAMTAHQNGVPIEASYEVRVAVDGGEVSSQSGQFFEAEIFSFRFKEQWGERLLTVSWRLEASDGNGQHDILKDSREFQLNCGEKPREPTPLPEPKQPEPPVLVEPVEPVVSVVTYTDHLAGRLAGKIVGEIYIAGASYQLAQTEVVNGVMKVFDDAAGLWRNPKGAFIVNQHKRTNLTPENLNRGDLVFLELHGEDLVFRITSVKVVPQGTEDLGNRGSVGQLVFVTCLGSDADGNGTSDYRLLVFGTPARVNPGMDAI